MIIVVEESNYSEHQSGGQQHGFKGGPIVIGRIEGEGWWELCLLSLEELLNLELFVCVDPQLNNSLQELNLGGNRLTDEFTADDNFIHLGRLKKLELSRGSFSEAGIAAISLLLQVQLPFDLCVRSFVLIRFQTPLSLFVFLVK